ncbi:hypothetical protein DITRI_Ditri01bG0160200 [Diplodiscus trichospermus]
MGLWLYAPKLLVKQPMVLHPRLFSIFTNLLSLVLPLYKKLLPFITLQNPQILSSFSSFIKPQYQKDKKHEFYRQIRLDGGNKHWSGGSTERSRALQVELCFEISSTACQV